MEIGKPLKRHHVVPLTEPAPGEREPQRTPSLPISPPASPQPVKTPEPVR